jgi:hypothetical protein
MRFCIKSGIIGLSLVAGVILGAAHLNAALAKNNAQANFQSQQRADQRAFMALPTMASNSVPSPPGSEWKG